MSYLNSDPIVAIATAPGRGGIGVVRISGRNLSAIVQSLFVDTIFKPRHARYLPFTQSDGSVIDQGIALFFRLRIPTRVKMCWNCKGMAVLLSCRCCSIAVLKQAKEAQLRLAQPGEFTQRAFMNDKLDLAQAEAVADLIEASTEAAAKSASQSLSGAFSKVIHQLVERVVHLRMLVEATLDFPEEEIDF